MRELMSLKGFNPKKTAKSRTIIGGLICITFISPATGATTIGASEAGVAGGVFAVVEETDGRAGIEVPELIADPALDEWVNTEPVEWATGVRKICGTATLGGAAGRMTGAAGSAEGRTAEIDGTAGGIEGPAATGDIFIGGGEPGLRVGYAALMDGNVLGFIVSARAARSFEMSSAERTIAPPGICGLMEGGLGLSSTVGAAGAAPVFFLANSALIDSAEMLSMVEETLLTA